MWNSKPANLEGIKMGHISLSLTTQYQYPVTSREGVGAILDTYNSCISSYPCASNQLRRDAGVWLGELTGSWVLVTVGVLCARTVKTLWLCGRAQDVLGLWGVTVGSSISSGLPESW